MKPNNTLWNVDEEWAPIEGFPNYVVSNHGRVWNLKLDRILEGTISSYGHRRVGLRDETGIYIYQVGQLVAKAFIGGYTNRSYVRHFDGNNANDHVNNLRLTNGRPMRQLKRYEKKPEARKLRVVETGMVFRTASDAARYMKTHSSNIYKVLRGERNSCRGYTFEYI